MKTSTILLSITLAFTTIYSKAIDNNNSYETVKINNFSYKFHCSEEKKVCDGYKNDIKFACNTLSNTFGKYKFYFQCKKYCKKKKKKGLIINYIE